MLLGSEYRGGCFFFFNYIFECKLVQRGQPCWVFSVSWAFYDIYI